ncbi:MAG: hypothetical protein QXS32_08720 [Candidatus Nezhaarchaeales archaeon]
MILEGSFGALLRGPMGAVIGGLGEHWTRARVGGFKSGNSSKERIR